MSIHRLQDEYGNDLTCINLFLEVDKNNNLNYELETNGQTFERVEIQIKQLVAKLQNRLDNPTKCPYYPSNKGK